MSPMTGVPSPPALSTAIATLPSAVQAFLKSVGQVEQSIARTTPAASVITAYHSSFTAQQAAIRSYLSGLEEQPAVSSILGELPEGLAEAPDLLNYSAPLIEEYGSELPDDIRSVMSQIVSFEDSVRHVTVTAIYESGFEIEFPSTTITGGTFAITPTASTGATAAASGPVATGASSSSSSAAAATGLGCGGSCRIMAGAMAGVALRAFAL